MLTTIPEYAVALTSCSAIHRRKQPFLSNELIMSLHCCNVTPQMIKRQARGWSAIGMISAQMRINLTVCRRQSNRPTIIYPNENNDTPSFIDLFNHGLFFFNTNNIALSTQHLCFLRSGREHGPCIRRISASSR